MRRRPRRPRGRLGAARRGLGRGLPRQPLADGLAAALAAGADARRLPGRLGAGHPAVVVAGARPAPRAPRRRAPRLLREQQLPFRRQPAQRGGGPAAARARRVRRPAGPRGDARRAAPLPRRHRRGRLVELPLLRRPALLPRAPPGQRRASRATRWTGIESISSFEKWTPQNGSSSSRPFLHETRGASAPRVFPCRDRRIGNGSTMQYRRAPKNSGPVSRATSRTSFAKSP